MTLNTQMYIGHNFLYKTNSYLCIRNYFACVSPICDVTVHADVELQLYLNIKRTTPNKKNEYQMVLE